MSINKNKSIRTSFSFSKTIFPAVSAILLATQTGCNALSNNLGIKSGQSNCVSESKNYTQTSGACVNSTEKYKLDSTHIMEHEDDYDTKNAIKGNCKSKSLKNKFKDNSFFKLFRTSKKKSDQEGVLGASQGSDKNNNRDSLRPDLLNSIMPKIRQKKVSFQQDDTVSTKNKSRDKSTKKMHKQLSFRDLLIISNKDLKF